MISSNLDRLSTGARIIMRLRQNFRASSNQLEALYSSGIWKTGVICLGVNEENFTDDSLSSSRDRAEWVGKIRDLVEVHEKGAPQFRHMRWKKTFDTEAYQRFFEPPKEESWSYHITGSKESAVDRASSKSYIAVLPDNEKKEVQDKIRKIVDEDTSKVWINESEGTFEYPYKSYVVVCHKKA